MTTTKDQQYQAAIADISALIKGEPNLIANLANTAAELRTAFDFFWVGFYLVDGRELTLGPFQGPSACTRIAHGRGVCGTSWAHAESIIVPDVHQFPGHIACSPLSKSEIVVPIIKSGKVRAILDIDSPHLNAFDQTDQTHLEHLAQILSESFSVE